MKEDVYKQLLGKARNDKPQLRDLQSFKSKVMREIEPNKRSSGLIMFIRGAASILLFLGLGAYIWMEVYTWEERLAVEQRSAPADKLPKSDWQCRQTVNQLLTSLFETSALVRHNDGVLINKRNVKFLEVENAELYAVMESVLGHIEQFSPSDFQAYQSGENIEINAWQLRREYNICEWITK